MSVLTRTFGLLLVAAVATILVVQPALAQDDGWRTIEIETTEVTAPHVAVSPDGEWLVFTMLGHLFRLPVEGGTAEQMTFGPYYHSDPVFSPDGLRLAFVSDRDGSDGNVFVLDLVDGQITQVTHEAWAERPTWTPDGESIVYLALMRELALSRFQSPPFAEVRRIGAGGGTTETLSDSPGFFRSVFHLADGRLAWTVLENRQSPRAATRIEVRGDDGTTSTLHLLEGVANLVVMSGASEGLYSRRYLPPRRGPEDLLFVPLGGGDARRVARLSDPLSEEASFGVSMDGRSLYLGQDGQLWRLALPGGTTHLVPFNARVRLEVLDPVIPERADLTTTRGGQRPRWILHPRLSPDGRSLVFGAAGYLWRQPLDGGVARRMFDGSGFEWEPAWSPDGQQLAFLHRESGEQEVRVFSFDEDQTRTLASGSRYFGLNWSPDGERVVFVEAARRAESIVAVSLDDGSRVQLVEALPSMYWARPHFSADGLGLFLSPGRASPPELGTLQRVVLDGSSEPQAFAHITDMRDALVAPGEDWLAFRRNAEIWVAPLDEQPVTEASVRLLSPVGGQTFSFTPDGMAVIYAQGDRVWRHPLTGGDPVEIPMRLELERPVPPAVLIRDVNVLDFNSGGFRGESSMLIEDGRIRWIDSDGDRSPPPGTAILDGGGRFAIPGLFDMHLHTEVTGAYQKALLAYGVTSVRDVGAPLPLVSALADRGEFTPNPVPRYFYSGDSFEGVQPDPPPQYKVKPTSPEEARRYVRLWDQMGVSFIKVHPPISWPLQRVVADEARALGLPVVGHGVTLEEMIKSVTLGYRSLEHGPNAGVYEDVLQLFATVGTRMTPTLDPNWGSSLRNRRDRKQFTDPKLQAFIPEWWQITRGGPWSIDSPLMRGLWAERLAAVRSAYEAGVALQIGTDAQNGVPRRYHGVSLHWELENFVEASIPPLEVLRIATQEAAVAVGAEDDLGTLEVGKLADIVLLDANPLEDIKNTQTIWRVLKGGWVFDPAVLQPSSGN